jgi:nitrite reductase/ring-hydroxylating ferredoxin subunit
MDEFITVGETSEVPDGEARAFEIGGRRVAVARVGGSWFAFDDTCTHRLCSLADGEVEATSIVCPCHGSEFDMGTGAVLTPPATIPIATFAVRIEGDQIRVGPS